MSNKSVSASDAVKLASQMMSLLSTSDSLLDENLNESLTAKQVT
jgi:hypothetical protein